MLEFLKSLFGKSVNFKKLYEQGAQIIDVRTSTEFENEHFFKSINIPLQDLRSSINQIDRNRPVITCCATGSRSKSAKDILKEYGFEAYDGGPWQKLQKKIMN